MTIAHIGVGSNVGDRAKFCRRAVEELQAHPSIQVDAVSSLYETSPVGGPPQRSFVNLVCQTSVDVEVRELLEIIKQIEVKLGREPSDARWGPRVVDLDILTFGEDKINEADLEIPHPRMTRRQFVLVPLLEIDPGASDPWGRRYADWIEEAEGDVELLEEY